MTKKILGLVIAYAFVVNNLSYGLAPSPVSGTALTEVIQERAGNLHDERNDPRPVEGAISNINPVDRRKTVRDQMKSLSPAVDAYINAPVPLKIHCEVMDYDWGDPDFIPALIRVENRDGKPYAELWIGAHPKAPAKANVMEHETNLQELINGAAEEILGPEAARHFDFRLPYLLKVLTASTALSIQAHPTKEQAEEGWRREEGRGPNYNDDNHKPEIIKAVTKFWALNGFRPIKDIIEDFRRLDIVELRSALTVLERDVREAQGRGDAERNALRKFYASIMTKVDVLKKAVSPQDKDKAQAEISGIVRYVVNMSREKAARELGVSQDAALETVLAEAKVQLRELDLRRELWTLRLNSIYPDDMGVLSTYLLNLVRLNPGEAMYLDAGELHAYLGKLDPSARDEGMGIELMANSDNVLRGGLTPKHVDVPELLKTLSFKAGEPRILSPDQDGGYATLAAEFELTVIDIKPAQDFISNEYHSADSFIVFDGTIELTDSAGNSIRASRGETFMVPAAAGKYTIKAVTDNARVYRASVPRSTLDGIARQRAEEENRQDLSVEDRTAVWTAVSRLRGEKYQVIIPQEVRLTREMTRTLADVRVSGHVDIEVIRVKTQDLGKKLASAPENTRRIIVADAQMSKAIDSMMSDISQASLFRDVRVMRVNLPSNFANRDRETFFQARMVMMALLARVIEEGTNDARMLKALLEDMLRDSFRGTGISARDFVDRLVAREDSSTLLEKIHERLRYFISELRAVSLVTEIQREFLMVSEFWKYA